MSTFGKTQNGSEYPKCALNALNPGLEFQETNRRKRRRLFQAAARLFKHSNECHATKAGKMGELPHWQTCHLSGCIQNARMAVSKHLHPA